jgi:hypothetical protein
MLAEEAKNWKTPHGFQNTDAKGKTGGGGEFAKQVINWQTPATDLDQQARLFSLQHPRTSKHGPGCSCTGRILNPRFVEHLMNVPINFTDAGNPLGSRDFERWEMASSRSLRHLLMSRCPETSLAMAA